MSDTAHASAGSHGDHSKHYIKIWAILLALLVVSVVGPIIGEKLEHGGTINHHMRLILTLITAFGIAIVKAFMVVKHFMHINLEKKYVTYMVTAMVGFMLVFFGGTAPDVLEHEGTHWENVSAKEVVKRGQAAGAAGAEHHGGAAHPAEGSHVPAAPVEQEVKH
ncbi:MAG: cytochrome C oxidase subunit IV family protein [Myxococcaceae bacterium]|nr:cytochrome C oxidase subunit IV family protein [Myxococcaceae bacterium]